MCTFSPSQKHEAAEIVPLIYSAGPEAFDYVFTTSKYSALDFLAYAFTREGGEFGYQNHITVKSGNEIIGTGSVFCGNESLKFTIDALKAIISFYKWQALGVIVRGLRTEAILMPPIGSEFVLSHLGVKESYRGKGAGGALIDFLFTSAKITKEKRAILDVKEGNPAIHLYERKGFKVEKKNISNLKNQYSYVPNHFRMAKEAT